MFKAGMFIINWSAGEWINKLVYVHNEYPTSESKNEHSYIHQHG